MSFTVKEEFSHALKLTFKKKEMLKLYQKVSFLFSLSSSIISGVGAREEKATNTRNMNAHEFYIKPKIRSFINLDLVKQYDAYSFHGGKCM